MNSRCHIARCQFNPVRTQGIDPCFNFPCHRCLYQRLTDYITDCFVIDITTIPRFSYCQFWQGNIIYNSFYYPGLVSITGQIYSIEQQIILGVLIQGYGIHNQTVFANSEVPSAQCNFFRITLRVDPIHLNS